ncbi:WecB/TagA/CpsF family glycosyltransferase [Castellaniella sp. GW247-6E4]|uniref:WecB/TagA/CpsF family glycosyltransferase n=1 Tax=Castellaniella sp. GW247-6E4 TaxID=3140380 RepID=UPI003314AA60
MNSEVRRRIRIIGAPIDALDWSVVVERISRWATKGESRVVCICNAHSVVTSKKDERFLRIISEADMATPDGAPVAWMIRMLGMFNQSRINGPDLMWRYCAYAEKVGEKVYLYGASESTLEKLQVNLLNSFPALKIVGAYSPPFRALSVEEDKAIVDHINRSGARVVWVGLGCPKQEQWMAAHRDFIQAVMIGVGAAFDYHAGTVLRAPLWMQRYGLEWFYRLLNEPRRLWRRYLITNTLFIWYAACQLLFSRRRGSYLE